MSLTTLRTDVHNLVLNARRLERVVNSPEFEALYSTLSVEDKAHVARLVKDLLTDHLLKFIQTKLQKDIGEQSIRQLRLIASRYGIPGYSLMTKDQLLREILNEQGRLRSRVGQASGVESRPGGVLEQGEEGTKIRPGEVPQGLLAVSN